MTRNLDPTLAAGLSAGLIQPVVLVSLTLKSGVENVWSGIGDLVWNGITFSGVGYLGSIGPIGEGSAVKADGTTVTLSGIGFSAIDVPGSGITPPTLTPPTGQSIAWSYATTWPTPGAFENLPGIFNGDLGVFGSVSGSRTTGNLSLTNGQTVLFPGQSNTIGGLWSGFQMPPEIPVGARITGVYPVVTVSAIGQAGGQQAISCSGASTLLPPSGYPQPGTIVGPDMGKLAGNTFEAILGNTAIGPANFLLDLSFVGIAVYYEGTPQSKTSLIYEALGDIRPGAPAKIWYGLMSAGSFLGTPYLIFSGQVDKPTLKTGVETSSITVALENRLVNLQRPNARRYTAADQRLYFPTDSAFNFVEILNDMALVWG
jgi:hypothetical protein